MSGRLYLHVLADELDNPLLHHGVGHVNSKQDTRGIRRLRVPLKTKHDIQIQYVNSS